MELQTQSDHLSVKYGGEECMKSYAEWNSFDIGLSLLLSNVDNGNSNVNDNGRNDDGDCWKEDKQFGEIARVIEERQCWQ